MTTFSIDDLIGDMPLQKIEEALDDDGDGIADAEAFAGVLKSANGRASAIFGGDIPPRYQVAVDHAVRVFCLDLLYRRRGSADSANPWSALADAEVSRLRALASGQESIDSSTDGVVFAKDAKIYNTNGVLS